MGKVTGQISISLDGFVAGPNQSNDNPIGEGGMRLSKAHRTQQRLSRPLQPLPSTTDIADSALRDPYRRR